MRHRTHPTPCPVRAYAGAAEQYGSCEELSGPFSSCTARLHAALALPVPSSIRQLCSEYMRAGSDMVWTLFDLLRSGSGMHNTPRGCAGPACRRTSVSGGCGLYICGGCLCVRYCSRACQKAAWRSTPVPHRVVCSKLRAVMENAVLCDGQSLCKMERVDFLRRCADAQLDRDFVSLAVKHLTHVNMG